MVDDGHEFVPRPVEPAGEPQASVPDSPPSVGPAGRAEEIRHPDGRVEHPGVRFEATDVSIRGVVAVVAVAACLLPLFLYFVMMFFQHDERRQQELKQTSFPLAAGRPSGLPVEPRLEQLDRLAGIETPDASRLQAAAEATLHGYGNTSDAGFVHVPIDWAIQQAVERLPSKGTKAESPAKDRGLLDAGEPNSGRLFRGVSK